MSQRTMLSLTLRHPWAYAFRDLGKRIENRTWKPGRFQLAKGDWMAIHGGAWPRGRVLEEARQDLASLIGRGLAPEHLEIDDTILEGIVAVARFDGTITNSVDPWFAGPTGWVFDRVVGFPEPVPCVGAQGLWRLPDQILSRVRQSYVDAVRAEATS